MTSDAKPTCEICGAEVKDPTSGSHVASKRHQTALGSAPANDVEDATPLVIECSDCGRRWSDDPPPTNCPRCDAPLA